MNRYRRLTSESNEKFYVVIAEAGVCFSKESDDA